MSGTSLTSPCLPDALAALGARRMVVIDGAVDDDVLLFSDSSTLTRALARGWREVSRALPVVWQPGSGLATVDPADRPRLAGLLEAAMPDDDAQAAFGDDPLATVEPRDVASLLARLFESAQSRVLVIVEHADLICATTPDPINRGVVAATLTAVEAFEQARPLHGLVLLTRDLGRLAPTIVQRAGAARLRIAAKSSDELALVASRAFKLPLDDDRVARLALAAEGFALREVAMLPAHAHASGIELAQPRELTASFRHGHRVDPWASLTPARMVEIRAQVRERVYGQPRAVEDVLDRLDVARSGLELDPPSGGTRKSRLELFLVGPTGVGKNELARALARAIFGDSSAVLTFDMSAFQQEHSGEQLFGAPPGYVGHERGSPLVDRLRERPFTVIVFDEIEKAHPNNWLRLMAAVDEGRVTDTRQVQASLEHAIVIFTSNIGGDTLLERAAERLLSTEEVESLTLATVETHLSSVSYTVPPSARMREGLGKPEVWGRLSGSVVPFDLLRPDALARIVARFCSTLADSAQASRGIDIAFDVGSVTHAVARELGAPGTWNGRLIKGHVDRLVRRPLARRLAREDFDSTTRLGARLGDEGQLQLTSR